MHFFLNHITQNNKYFWNLFEEYISFLESNNFSLSNLTEYITKYRIFYHNGIKKPNILFFSGFLDQQWNQTIVNNGALGGSESSVAFLSDYFTHDYNVYIAGDVMEEIHDNKFYINNSNLKYLIDQLNFKVVIISRFLLFLEAFQNIKTQKIYLWAHDLELISTGTQMTSNELIQKWNHKINGCICLTNWHKNIFEKKYPELKNKINVINNGIKPELFNNINTKKKIKNQFIYTSRSERGLLRLLELWEKITSKVPSATLVLASYLDFPNPKNHIDTEIEKIIKNFHNVKHYGKLNKNDLYQLMAKSEYWFYPCSYPETSCITAMEMMMSEVICIYYPFAGLVNTIGEYGLEIVPSKINEIEYISHLCNNETSDIKKIIKEKAKNYALSCSWKNRSTKWFNLINKKNKICILNLYSKN